MRNKQAYKTQTYKQYKSAKKGQQTDTCSENFTQIYSARKILQYITVRNHTLHIVVSISANCKYIFNLELNCLTEQ